MTIWSTYYSYQYPFASLSDFNYNSMAYSNLFSMPMVPRVSVFDGNIFGFTPPANFCNLSTNTASQQYFAPINLTNPFMTYDFQPRVSSDNLFAFLNTKTTPQFSTNFSSSNNVLGFLNVTANKNRVNNTSYSTSGTYRSNYRTTSFNTSCLPSLKNAGYNSEKAQKLANAINSASPHHWGDKLCAKHVKDAISKAGLGQRMSGNASDLISQLRNNPNFREISASGVNLSQLPAGCILVYDKGVAGYSSQYGHTEITLGNGQALSSGYTNYIRSGARVFIPV